MENVKTTISLPKSLFEQAEELARKMKVSRSRLFALALEDFLQRQQNRDLLAQINAAYAGEPDPTEETLRHMYKPTHRSILRGIPGEQLLRFAGTDSVDDARLMGEVIEQDCEQVDTDEIKS